MKRLLFVLVGLAVLAGAGLAAFVWLYNPEAQREALERRLSAAFGRPVTVGPMRLTLLPVGVEARDVRVDSEPSFGEGAFLTVDRVQADLALWDYVVHRTPVIERIELERPRFTLVKREDGVWNFSTLGAGRAAAAAPARGGPVLAAAQGPALPVAAPSVTPRRIEARDGEVTVVDRTAAPAAETTYKGLALESDVERLADGYRMRGRVTGDSAAAGGEPLAADLPFDAVFTPPGQAPAWQAKGSVPSGSVATRNFRIDSVRTDFALDAAQTLRLAPLSLGLYGGTFEGESSLDLSARSNRFRTAGRAAGVALGDALAPHPELGGRLQGSLDAQIDVTGELGDFNATLASLGGGGRVAITDARLTSVNLLAEVAQQGGFERIEFDEPGTRAGRIEADVRFEGGRALFENARVSDINDYASVDGGTGWVELRSPASIRLDGSVTILPALFDKVAQADPLAGVVLGIVRSGQVVTVPISVNGPVARPSVAVRWGSVLRMPFPFGL